MDKKSKLTDSAQRSVTKEESDILKQALIDSSEPVHKGKMDDADSAQSITDTNKPKENNMFIMNGDHLEYELENKGVPPEERADWPLPSFDARDWAKAFCKLFPDSDEELMVTWFANALMRGYDEGLLNQQPRKDSGD